MCIADLKSRKSLPLFYTIKYKIRIMWYYRTWALQPSTQSLKTAFHNLMFYFFRKNKNVTNNVINPKVY